MLIAYLYNVQLPYNERQAPARGLCATVNEEDQHQGIPGRKATLEVQTHGVA
jgi:hypothetical protein